MISAIEEMSPDAIPTTAPHEVKRRQVRDSRSVGKFAPAR